MKWFHTFALLAASLPLSAAGEVAGKPASPGRPVPAALQRYINCKLPIGPDLVQHTSLPQAPMTRVAQTFTGPRNIRLVDGIFAAYAYPGEAPFANVKIELLPATGYLAEKSNLIGEFDKINAAGEDTQRNYALRPTLNGFEIYGFDRTALDGKVLGIYLFFDNANRVATTAYFLNAPAGERKFTSITEYDQLREAFLNAYTNCVRRSLSATPSRKPPASPARRRRH